MKILWHSVAPWVGTGYGMQTAQATPRIHKMGHDVAISAYYGLAGTTLEWEGMKVYPQFAEGYGVDIVVPHALHHFGAGPGHDFRNFTAAGWIITLGDVWVFQAPLLQDMSVAAWVPIDHETIPPVVRQWFDQNNAVPIAMSQFGHKRLVESGLEHALYVPHAIDTNVFRPGDKDEARERAGLPKDAFVVAMVAANYGKDAARKAFYEQILAFAQLHAKHPDAVLALHTNVSSPRQGVDIHRLLDDAGLPKTAYVISDQYRMRIGVPAEAVADIYRAADVLTNTSWGEGFGVTIVEAQACGTPVVVTDTTSMPELCGSGWLVDTEPWWHDSMAAWARKPLIGSIVESYEQAYSKARDTEVRARAFAFAQDYDADLVAEKFWRPALSKLEYALEQRQAELDAPREHRMQVAIAQSSDGLLWLNRGRKSGDVIGYADHEPEMMPIFEANLPTGGVFLDVGAHVGHYSVRLASRASKVFAVECNPETVKTLRKNLALNEIENVMVLDFAAWDEDRALRLDDPLHQVAGGSTRTLPAADGGMLPDAPGTWVAAHRLDEELPDLELGSLDRLDLVKMDLEGSDLHALRGMSGLLSAYHPVLLIECHDQYGYYARSDLEGLLTELGYTFEVCWSQPTNWMPDGPTDDYRPADYLLCRPREAD